MTSNKLVRAAFTYTQTRPNGSVLTILQVYTSVSLSPNSAAGQRLLSAIVSHMQRFPSIDRADIN